MGMFRRSLEVDTRTPSEVVIDEEYDAMILRVLGQDALRADELPEIDRIPFEGMAIVRDTSDLGYRDTTKKPPTKAEQAAMVHHVIEAVRQLDIESPPGA